VTRMGMQTAVSPPHSSLWTECTTRDCRPRADSIAWADGLAQAGATAGSSSDVQFAAMRGQSAAPMNPTAAAAMNASV
jgi:hypothetical protein